MASELFLQNDFNDFIIRRSVLGFFEDERTLKSGRRSHWYVNWRTPAEDLGLTVRIAQYVSDFCADLDNKTNVGIESIHGVPEGATKVALFAHYFWASRNLSTTDTPPIGEYSLSMGRGKAKDHGDPKDRYFLGLPRGATVLLEDVTTTGDSMIGEARKLKNAGVDIVAALGLTHRNQLRDDGSKVEDFLMSELNIPYFALSNGLDLLPLAYKKLQPGTQVAEAIEREFKQYGEKSIKLR